jgi:hypothetical protein
MDMNRLETLISNPDFWAALITLLTTILVSLNVPQGSITQIITIISATGAFVAFVLGKTAVQIAQIKLKTARLENETAKLNSGK